MAKSVRGKNVKGPGWRGTCPECSKTGVKLLWNKKTSDGKQIKVCKVCGSK